MEEFCQSTIQMNDRNLINYNSEFPLMYKIRTKVTLINWAFKISSDWKILTNEINRLKQIFINNNLPNDIYDNCVKNFINTHFNSSTDKKIKNKCNVYYKNQISINFWLD